MSKSCSICQSPYRFEIENAILAMSSSKEGYTLEDIATRYEVDVEALRVHALFHTPLVSSEDLEQRPKISEEEPIYRDSLTRKMRLRESDMLAEVSNEYLVTLKSMGRRLNRMIAIDEAATPAADDDQTYRLAKLLTKPMVDLYIGLGSEIRQTVKTMADIDRMLNGPQDDTTSGLLALANAIRGSDSE